MGKSDSRSRRMRERRYDQCYLPWRPYGDRCFYCGVYAGTVDHVPPLNSLYCLGTDFFTQKGIPIVKVPACLECNTVLGAKILETLDSRKKHIERYLDRKYESLITAEKWDEDEIAEMRGMMREVVANAEGQRALIVRRLDWSRIPAQMPNWGGVGL